MTCNVYANRYLGGASELNMWKERYTKDLRFATVDDLATQARHGLYPVHRHRKTQELPVTLPGPEADYMMESRRTQSMIEPVRIGHQTGWPDPQERTTSVLAMRPELPALTRDLQPNVRSSTAMSHREMEEARRERKARRRHKKEKIPLFGSTYQNDFVNQYPRIDRLDIGRVRYGMPRDYMVAYRENCHESVGKASLFVKSAAEAAQSLKKFDMTRHPGEYKF